MLPWTGRHRYRGATAEEFCAQWHGKEHSSIAVSSVYSRIPILGGNKQS